MSAAMTVQGSPNPPDFMFHSVSQLGRDLGVTARTIRFYEDKKLIAPQRAGTARVYTNRDRARLILILRGKRLGFSLREIAEFLDLYDADPQHRLQTRRLQAAVAKRVERLREQRRAIDQSLVELAEIDRQCAAALTAQAAEQLAAPGAEHAAPGAK